MKQFHERYVSAFRHFQQLGESSSYSIFSKEKILVVINQLMEYHKKCDTMMRRYRGYKLMICCQVACTSNMFGKNNIVIANRVTRKEQKSF